MAFMLKITWQIKEGREADFAANQAELCKVMLEHPGVITYHAEYPSPNVCEWLEIYSNDSAFRSHLGDEAGKAPLGALFDAATVLVSRCFGDPDEKSRKILGGLGTVFEDTAPGAFVLNPSADKDSEV